jgi:hypothetical protein
MNTQPSHYRLYRDTISVQPGIEIAGSSSHPKECVVLSDDERKTLREVERQLMLEDPEFAQSFPLISSTHRAIITGRPTRSRSLSRCC